MKKIISALILFAVVTGVKAQTKEQGYEIKLTIKGLKDSACYLTRYRWEGNYYVDTAVAKKGGVMVFKGKEPLEKGLYSIVGAQRNVLYFDLPITEQKLTIVTDTADIYKNMKITGPSVNEDFRQFVIVMSTNYKEAYDFEQGVKKRKDPDSTKLIRENKTKHYEDIKKYQKDYLAKNPNTYLSTIIRLQNDVEVPPAPKASNGRKDSTWEYNYYVQHYWDGIPLNDKGTVNTNHLYANKLKTYFEKTLIQAPDTLIKYADWLVKQTGDDKEMFKFTVYYLTKTSEDSKIMGHDAVFVDMINKYYRTHKAFWVDEKTNNKIVERGDILEPLLLGKKAPEMNMIDTTGAKTIKKLGMDTITSSERLTTVFTDNYTTLQKLFVPLYNIKADYTVVVFWDVDCGHCQKEIPKLKEIYDKLKAEGKSVEVYSVYTHFEVDKWKKFIKDHKLTWVNVYNGVHLIDLKVKFDIYSTPRIFLLDKNKVIKAKQIGAEQVEDLINALSKLKS
ncbi:MAG TPA: thioredoxin-like domain-containing protein [Bacteroidia bacterium]|nr:thioredoxin-like domain-containing protein [Bacteroidia bacterium]